MKRHSTLLVVSVALLLYPSVIGRAAGRHEYLKPVEHGGMAFPVLRSDWYSVINFRNDWHAPRMRFISGKWRQVGIHEGNDIFAEPGTPVVAIAPGRIERVGWTFYSGYRVGVRDVGGRYWFYAHLRRYAPQVSVGRVVGPGDELGEVGNTGYGATPGHHDEFPAHLHVGIQEPSGEWTNPYPLMKDLYQASVQKP